MEIKKVNNPSMKNSLESQLAEAKKQADQSAKLAEKSAQKVKSLQEKINKKAEAKKPKPIQETVTTLAQVYAKLKVNPRKDVIKIEGFTKEDKEVVENIIARMRVCKVYNEGELPKKNHRCYPWFMRKSSGSGLAFVNSYCNDDSANSSSASRLSFKNLELSTAYAKNFINVEEGIIQL